MGTQYLVLKTEKKRRKIPYFCTIMISRTAHFAVLVSLATTYAR